MTCTPHLPPAADGSPRSFDPAWRTETVLALAKGIEAESAFDRLPILADALEEAGCDDELLLRHCRECEWHEEECWVVSFALDRPPPLTWEQLQERLQREAAQSAVQPERTSTRIFGHPPEYYSRHRFHLLFLLALLVCAMGMTVLKQPTGMPPSPHQPPQPKETRLERLGRELDALADYGPPHPDAVRQKKHELWNAYFEEKLRAAKYNQPAPKRPPQLGAAQ